MRRVQKGSWEVIIRMRREGMERRQYKKTKDRHRNVKVIRLTRLHIFMM